MHNPITTLEQFEAEYRKGIGIEMDLNDQRFLKEVTRDNILNFADAVGDNNPLWINEDYAAQSRFGSITAPPTSSLTSTTAHCRLTPALSKSLSSS